MSDSDRASRLGRMTSAAEVLARTAELYVSRQDARALAQLQCAIVRVRELLADEDRAYNSACGHVRPGAENAGHG